MSESELRELSERIRRFSEERNWEQFHNPKNLAMALVVEAAELVEEFQWLTPEEAAAVVDDREARERVEGEMADVVIYLLRLADVLGVDLRDAVEKKLEMNEARFPRNSESAFTSDA